MGRALAAHVVRDHVLLGGVLAAIFGLAMGYTWALLFWMATVLIDVDHHWAFVWRSGLRDAFRLRKMLAYHRVLFATKPSRYFVALDPLHTLEFVLLLAVARARWPSVMLDAVLWGVVAHLLIDVGHQVRYGRTFARAYSVLEYVIRRRMLVARGLSPDGPFREALGRVAEGLPQIGPGATSAGLGGGGVLP